MTATWQRVAVVVVVVAVGAVVLLPRARDSWVAFRTGVAPGSIQGLRASAAPDGTTIVVGYVPLGDRSVPSAWMLDGDEWREIGDRRADRLLLDVVVDGDRVVAVGSERGSPAVFERPLRDRDVPWQLRFRSSRGPGELAAVVSTPHGVIAAGTFHRETGTTAAAVSERDGAWAEETIDASATVSAIAVTGDGGSVIVGGRGAQAGAVWMRPGVGGAWVRTDLPGGPRSFVTALAAVGGRVVALGPLDLAPTAWVQGEDGAWGDGVPLPGSGPGRRVEAAAVVGGQVVAVGAAVGVGDVQRPLAWASDDASTWRELGAGGADETGYADVLGVTGDVVAVGNGRDGRRLEVERHVLRRGAFVIAPAPADPG